MASFSPLAACRITAWAYPSSRPTRRCTLLLDLPKDQGLVVRNVAPESRAAKAKIQNNDILLELNEKPLSKLEDLPHMLADLGEKAVTIKLLRAGKPMTVTVEPAPEPEPDASKPEERYVFGISLNPLDPAIRAQLGLPPDQGMVIGEIVPDSAAAEAKLQVHDILLKVNGQPINGIEQLIEFLKTNKDKPVEVKLLREGKETTVQVTPHKETLRYTRTRPLPVPPFMGPGGALRFMGPGVFIGPNGERMPAPPAGQPLRLGVRALDFLSGPPPGDIAKRLDEMSKRLDALQKVRREAGGRPEAQGLTPSGWLGPPSSCQSRRWWAEPTLREQPLGQVPQEPAFPIGVKVCLDALACRRPE